MLNKPNLEGRLLSAGVGSTVAATICVANGQSPLTTVLVISFAAVLALVLDEYGIL